MRDVKPSTLKSFIYTQKIDITQQNCTKTTHPPSQLLLWQQAGVVEHVEDAPLGDLVGFPVSDQVLARPEQGALGQQRPQVGVLVEAVQQVRVQLRLERRHAEGLSVGDVPPGKRELGRREGEDREADEDGDVHRVAVKRELNGCNWL